MVKIVENALVVYTDGSLYPRGRRGGYGAVFVHINEIGEETVVLEHDPPGARGTTGNCMELTAVVEAIRMAPDLECYLKVDRIVVRTDSQYVQKNCTSPLAFWMQNKWRDRAGRPIDNVDLWKAFVRQRSKLRKRLEIEKVQAHGRGKDKDIYNDRADKLAKASALNPLSTQVHLSSTRRKLGSGRTRKGSIKVSGQLMTIRIISAQWLKQREWKYRYQEIVGGEALGDAIDFIYSKIALRDGHVYKVRVNDANAYPCIVELLEEVVTDS